jgi:hypothetical protein
MFVLLCFSFLSSVADPFFYDGCMDGRIDGHAVSTRSNPRTEAERKAMAELQCHSEATREKYYVASSTIKRKLTTGSKMINQLFTNAGVSDDDTDDVCDDAEEEET